MHLSFVYLNRASVNVSQTPIALEKLVMHGKHVIGGHHAL